MNNLDNLFFDGQGSTSQPNNFRGAGKEEANPATSASNAERESHETLSLQTRAKPNKQGMCKADSIVKCPAKNSAQLAENVDPVSSQPAQDRPVSRKEFEELKKLIVEQNKNFATIMQVLENYQSGMNKYVQNINA